MTGRTMVRVLPQPIGELAQRAGINPRTLRYYERIGLLASSARTEAGYRLYSEEDADQLAFIRRAQTLGLSLAEIADIIALRDGVPLHVGTSVPSRSCGSVRSTIRLPSSRRYAPT